MLEADITLAEARARFSGRDPVAVQMADPPFERPLGDRIGADSELVRRSEEHTSELQSLMRISYAVFCLKKKTQLLNSPPNHIFKTQKEAKQQTYNPHDT